MRSLAMLLPQLNEAERASGDEATTLVSAAQSGECCMETIMEFEEYDFTRNPIVEDQAFFLESKCIHCGFAVVASSVEQLLEEEEHHRAHCTFMRAVS
jgi:hypothetical protein